MFLKDRKAISPQEFGELIASFLMHSMFPNGDFKDKDIRIKMFKQVPEDVFIKDWLIYNCFLFTLAFSTVFKDDKMGQDAHQHFAWIVKDISSKTGLFISYDECDKMFKSRYATYDEEISSNREPNYIYWIAKRFFQFCGGEVSLVNQLQFAATYPTYLEADIELLCGINKETKFVLEG